MAAVAAISIDPPNVQQRVQPVQPPPRTAANGNTILLDVADAANKAPEPEILGVPRRNKMARAMIIEPVQEVLRLTEAREVCSKMCADDAAVLSTVDVELKWHVHHVSSSDSLSALSIRYKVTVSELIRWNKLPNSSKRKIPTKTLNVLINPDCPELRLPDEREQNMTQLRHATGLSYAEAKFYLDSGSTYEDALSEAQQDLKWEAQQQQKPTRTVQSLEVEKRCK